VFQALKPEVLLALLWVIFPRHSNCLTTEGLRLKADQVGTGSLGQLRKNCRLIVTPRSLVPDSGFIRDSTQGTAD
jgi:hypothetical protein